MRTKLDEIIANKHKEVAAKKKKRDFLGAILYPTVGDFSIIAEIKLVSPSAGKLGDDKELEGRVIAYGKGGADAVSLVVDNKYFGGDLELIKKVKNIISLPILAKDFIIDPYQIYEMKVYGADAVLLIVKILPFGKLVEFVKLVKELNMEPVVEVQNEQELANAIQTDPRIIAVNARNLDTFKMNVDRACELIGKIPRRFIPLGFSGVSTKKEIEKYREAGTKGVLVGTSLMRSENPERLIKELKNP